MNRTATFAAAALVGIAALVTAGRAGAAEYWLWAGEAVVQMPDGEDVAVWGFAEDDTGSFSDGLGGVVQVPGPALTVPPGDNTLIIHLAADDQLPVPVSLVIPGLPAAMTPVRGLDGRVRSFTAEAVPGAPVTYTFSPVAPGTYLYHSGTNPAVQVQMGLYGSARKDATAAPAEAYPGVPYDTEVTLLYSEIDPVLHAAVATGNYGPGAAVTSAINYRPRYFLVNGQPFMPGQLPVPVGLPGQRTLIRFLNAGLMTHVPVLVGAHLELVAEDGRPYTYPREQYSVDLPALKTVDAILINPAAGIYALYDRRLSLTNAGGTTGGLFTRLQVAGAGP